MKIEMSCDVNSLCDGYLSIKDGLVSDLPLYSCSTHTGLGYIGGMMWSVYQELSAHN